MVGFITCKNEEDSIKNEGARVATTLHTDFSDPQGKTTQWCDLTEMQTVQALMHVLTTCRNEEDSIKNEVARVATTFLPL